MLDPRLTLAARHGAQAGGDNTRMLLRILSFNVGVEVGQMAALTAMVGLLAFWRHRPSLQRFSPDRFMP